MIPESQSSPQFLTPEESSAVDGALLASHEKFLTRLTISSLKLLKHIAQDTGVAMEDLTPQQVIAWFEQDGKIRREQGVEAAFLKW
ncbi:MULTISPECIES: hypothetical protein [Planktothricoides]|uniref:Uncharacterized protein n=2 Tax=Planktothricoides raciborskii TaxID=132608 RepID=A0AAU8JB24_9CYAN|nr:MULTISPECIES: hypothetical protein [Planktothricoides]KOR38016.1 hypothetical protein AM228_04370 [Planktothricoides sp. SR001]MBD2542881.1 hypothetical protein [Planktothricoides raciborskii FACHB-1370]MBD2581372.1 hypothetical protein [Planktothricoides raciborskii FACHB-1261]